MHGAIGFAIDIAGTLTLVFAGVNERTELLAGTQASSGQVEQALNAAGSAAGVLAVIYFPFFTPLGLFATYLTITGAFRGITAWFDDPRGDPILSAIDWAVMTLTRGRRLTRARRERERLEGPDAADVRRTGEWAGLPGVDCVVLSARRKADWTEGAIILTSTDWYRLGAPFDLQAPTGLRTAYPLTRITTLEVVRRGIPYELPPLFRSKSSAL